MAQTINTNVNSLVAQRNLARTQVDISTSINRLSSGLRVNSAKDDAAGLAIAERMNAQVRGMNVAMRNANDGISLAQTAESGLNEAGNMLQRMRELAVQSANGTNSSADRANLDAEFQALDDEIVRIANVTQFNGVNILQNEANTFTFQVGANSGETLDITTIDMTADAAITALNGGDVATDATAIAALDLIDTAIDLVTTERAKYGAAQSRFESTINNLQMGVEELSAYGSIRSAMNELGTISTTLGDRTTFGPFVATTSDEEVMTATANGTASAEAHDIEILSLATAQRLASGPVASPDADVDAGTYSFTAGEESFSFDLGAGSSLTNLRDAVNDAEDNPGVVASILNVGDGSRLILTARDTGIENAITVNPPGTSLLSGFTEMSAATDAQLIVDGFEVSSASNTVTDVIQGISLELADVGEVSISTARDAESLDESLEALVANYNTLRSGLDGLSIGTLQGDSLPRDIESRLRSLFSEPITLSDGSEASPLVDAFTDAEGIINGREESIQNRQGRIDDRIDLFDYRLGLVETRYRNQFTAMDTAIALLNSSSSQLFGALGT